MATGGGATEKIFRWITTKRTFGGNVPRRDKLDNYPAAGLRVKIGCACVSVRMND